MKTRLSFLCAITASMLLGACTSTKESVAVNDTPKSESTAEMASDDTRSTEEMEALFWQRRNEAKMNFVQADVDFMTGMIGHHAQALVMSALAPKNGASPAVATLCSRIINAQKDEINIMQTWLAERGQPVPQVHIEGLDLKITMGEEPFLHFNPDGEGHDMHDEHHMGEEAHDMDHAAMNHDEYEMGGESHDMDSMDEGSMNMEGHAMHDHTNMPGMLSQTQLEELAAAKGKTFDQLFLRYMIQHHSGAITMVNDLIAVDGAAQELGIEKLASEVNVDQKTEIERMRLMLTQMMDAEDSSK